MDFLLFTVTLGSFLILLSPSKGQVVELELPQYLAVSSTMKINCSFRTDKQPIKLVLENGRKALEASWDIGKDTYVYDDASGITLDWKLNSPKEGRYSFVFSRQLSCSDFTWYRCNVESPKVFSSNKTLQVAPEITSVAFSGGGSASPPSVNEFSTFICVATIPKEGSYSVRWFKGSTPSRNEISGGQTREFPQNSCSRTIRNELRYNVTQSDVPNLILTCHVSAGQTIEKTENFTIPEMATTPAPPISEAVKAGLDPGSIVGIVLGVTATIVLVVLLVWFLVIRPKRLKAGGSEGNTPEPYTKDYQEKSAEGQENPALDENHYSNKNDADNAPYTVYQPSKYDAPGGHANPAMDQDIPNHMSGSTV